MNPLFLLLGQRLAFPALALLAGVAAGVWIGGLHGRERVAQCQQRFEQYQAQAQQEAAQALAEAQRQSQANAVAYRLDEQNHAAAQSRLDVTFTELKHEAHTLPAPSVCALDADGLRLWNAANAATSPHP